MYLTIEKKIMKDKGTFSYVVYKIFSNQWRKKVSLCQSAKKKTYLRLFVTVEPTK